MQIVIDIPSAFIDQFHNDRFYDALMRLSSDAHLMAGQYEKETAEMLIKALEKAVEVPAHGRLVDVSALEVVAYTGTEGRPDTFDAGVKWLAEKIDKLPTVIPEEEP